MGNLYNCNGNVRGNKITRITLGYQSCNMSAGTYSVNCSNIKNHEKLTSDNFVVEMFSTGGIKYLANGGQSGSWSCENLGQTYNPITGIYTVNYKVAGDGSGWGAVFKIRATIIY